MERIESTKVHDGAVVSLRVERFRHADGGIVEREIVGHPAVAAIVAHDDSHVFLVRQPREAAGERSLLEIPAGAVDEGEDAAGCARRELAEEIGKQAGRWRELRRFYTSPGFATEEVHLFWATDLRDSGTEADPAERIEIVRHPLAELDGAIESVRDAKSLIGLLLLRELLRD